MNKLANMRHWSERMSPGFGMSRGPPGGPNMSMTPLNPQQQQGSGQQRLNGPGIGLGLSSVPVGGSMSSALSAGAGSPASNLGLSSASSSSSAVGQMPPQTANGGHPPHLNPHLHNHNHQLDGPGPQQGPTAPPQIVHFAFNIPLASDLAGPDTEDILHATTDAVLRWTHPGDAPDDVPVHELPVHVANLNHLREQCRILCASSAALDAQVVGTVPRLRSVSNVSQMSGPPGAVGGGASTTATPTNATPQLGSTSTPTDGSNANAGDAAESPPPRVIGPQVTTVYLAGDPELVMKARGKLLNESPLLKCLTVDIEGRLVCDWESAQLKKPVTDALDYISQFCGVDIFLLGPKPTPLLANESSELRMDTRWRVAIYGDQESAEHAKARVLIHIDKLLGRHVDCMILDPGLHPLICGRNRKHIKMIESATNTAIYFPPQFTHVFPYCPQGAMRRDSREILMTGETPEAIAKAKERIHALMKTVRLYGRELQLSAAKIDNILLTRLDVVRKFLDANSTYMSFPPLGSGRSQVRVQGGDIVCADRAARELMNLTTQFYSAHWWVQNQDGRQQPSHADVRSMLVDICANSNADVAYDKCTFNINGTDDAVKKALMVISKIKWATQSPHQIRVKIELANDHKEFVSGKKNGKINKIMSQSNVQIIFDSFGEFNFYIDILGASYDFMKNGLWLVEQEMPAAIAFHVPDQYHKRIIGIGGQHIQRIMKKHSVFVKFSNAMERGGMGREDDDIKVDNVVCRTPARNAQSLELVKSEILDMVDKADSEFTTNSVRVDRLYHRQLLARLPEIEELEKTWNCKITFPSTEEASDEIVVTGPQWQVPHCVDHFLGMVPDRHELVVEKNEQLVEYVDSADFNDEVYPKLLQAHDIQVTVRLDSHRTQENRSESDPETITLVFNFTRNNAGGLPDAIDYLQSKVTTKGIDFNVIQGHIPRPQQDSFEQSIQFFDSKLLQHAPAPIATDSPTKAGFGEETAAARERSTLFDRLRRPGSMSSISSFLDRRKNSSHSVTGPNSFFKGSSNVSKSSLISIESTRSFNADRNPWNDSGVNLPDEEHPWLSRPFGSSHGIGNGNGANGSGGNGGASSSNGGGMGFGGNGSGSGSGVDHKSLMPHNGNGGNHNHNNHNLAHPGDATPRHNTRASGDSGRPSTSHSTNSGYPGPMGPFR